ncbi:MAG: hypothetical protein KME17_27705 [Cyanosarcina radialis HA8281-LM2]|jgi:hypothetical protein|nr:hypothetical protein [Cyanosarcina radialis HA8281-LM2]
MSQPKIIANPEKIKLTVEQLRKSSRQLELVTLALDELIARIDTDLRCQRRTRLQIKQPPHQLESERSP